MSPPRTAVAGTKEVDRLPDLRICILHVPDCPLVSQLRADVEIALASVGARAVIEEIEGPYPSPTLLIDGIDVTGQALSSDPGCRLDLPAREQIVVAIRAAGTMDAKAVSLERGATQGGPGMSVKEHHDTRPGDWSCGPRALCGWSPPSLAADTALKRRVDLIRVGNVAAFGIVVVVVVLLNLAAHFSVRPALVTDGLAALVAGSWCSLNFWRCRHAHCLITGPGWIAFGLFALVEASIGRSLIEGYEQPVFMSVLGLAVIFEALWYVVHRTNAIAPHSSAGTY